MTQPTRGLEIGVVRLETTSGAWHNSYSRAARSIAKACGGSIVAVEHVGSTSVKGLLAKPIIDIVVGLRRLADLSTVVSALAQVGYHYEGNRRSWGGHLVSYTLRGRRTQLVHLVRCGGARWHRYLIFRDALRSEPKLRAEYAELKGRLAVSFPLDRESYAAAKAPFIDAVVKQRWPPRRGR